MIRRGFNAPRRTASAATSTRFGALVLGRPRFAPTKGRSRSSWNLAADPDERGRYQYAIDQASQPVADRSAPAVRDAVVEFFGGESVGAHRGARSTTRSPRPRADLVRAAARGAGRLPVVLAGGCFQNARLAETIVRGLQPEFTVHLHQRVPPGDGGIALGQAVVAAAKARSALMCLGVPGRVLEVARQSSRWSTSGACSRQVRLELVDEPVAPGDYILNHVGFAIRRIPAEDVQGRSRCTNSCCARPTDDLMAADVRGEIAGERRG